MSGRLEFDMNFGRKGRPRDESVPMRLLLLGDFSAKPVADRPPLAERQPVKVDVDTLDQALRRFAPRVTFDDGVVQFESFDDFHPDRLVTRLGRFRDLRDKRAQPPIEEDDTLSRLLGKQTTAPTPPPAPLSGLEALIHNAVAPHVVRDTTAQAKMHAQIIDASIADEMRGVLHHSSFQAIESTWRGVQWLVSNIELDDNLQLHLLDVTRDELIADIVNAQGQVTATGIYQPLVDRWRNVPGERGWSALISTLSFGRSDTDASLLAALGLLASQASAPLLAGAEWNLAKEPMPSSWSALRQSQVAQWIGLGTPRVLLRLPYGTRGEQVETFSFDEFSGEPEHEHFLWGSGALALALLIGRSFTARGWELELGDEREIDDLPAYVVDRDGERQLQPCAEYFLTERDIQQALASGLMPIASRRDRTAIVVVRFQSIASPTAPLVW